MTHLDPQLLQALAAADTPPPPGADFGPSSLAQAVRRRTRRLFAGATATLCVVVITFACWPSGRAADDDAARAAAGAELRALAAGINRLQASLRTETLSAARAAARDDAAALAIRYELASARAGAMHGFQTAETRR